MRWDRLRLRRCADVDVASAARRSCIYVIAGTNGAGKSSVAGAMFRRSGADYFNPDEATARVLAANPGTSAADANSAAWHQGRRLLERAIAERLDFAFETTLGGHTISARLHQASAAGIDVRIWFVGLRSPELHVARVRARVARGGHDIPEEKIRERYDRSRINLIELMPQLTELRVYDNSVEADPHTGRAPRPTLILHVANRKIVEMLDLSETPQWAKAVVAAAVRFSRRLAVRVCRGAASAPAPRARTSAASATRVPVRPPARSPHAMSPGTSESSKCYK